MAKTSVINENLLKGGAIQNSNVVGAWWVQSLKMKKRGCENKTMPLMFCMRLISVHCQKNCVWTSLKCHTSAPPDPWERISLPRALHGLWGADVYGISDYVWIFTFIIQGLIKDRVYRRNTCPFCKYVGKQLTNKPSVFPWSGVSSGLATSLILASNQRKR